MALWRVWVARDLKRLYKSELDSGALFAVRAINSLKKCIDEIFEFVVGEMGKFLLNIFVCARALSHAALVFFIKLADDFCEKVFRFSSAHLKRFKGRKSFIRSSVHEEADEERHGRL